MKKYSVFSLCVVKKKGVYFICKYGNMPNTYEEFFTKETIVEENEENVESLSKYYSLLGVKNYKTRESLKLSAKEILIKYIEINKFERLKNQEEKNVSEDPLFIQVWEETSNQKQKTKK